jgi:hypothetical protein
MLEPLPERLSRFTPDATGLDRDALLFAAGRASAPPHRGWAVLAGVLAASQVLTLALLWSRPAPRASIVATEPPPSRVLELPEAPHLADPSEVGVLTRRLGKAGSDDLPPAGYVDGLVPADPPLHAVTARVPPGLE